MTRRIVGFAATAAMTVGAISVVGAAPAAADTVPPDPGTPVTVASDPLPTVQINGVVWTQKVVGNIAYVGGQFTQARPAGAAPGTNETPRNNFLAYDVRTGQLLNNINLDFNAQVMTTAVSPDQTRLYVGGDFTFVNGLRHNRIVAINAATGQVIESFQGSTWARVAGIAATNSTVYAGGNFTAAGNGTARTGLAAFSAANGALLDWAPAIGGTSARVNAMTMNPSLTKVIAGGSFATINGVAAPGMSAIDAATGAVLPWQANTVMKNTGASAAILSLEADATSVYGSGYTYGPGDLEGAFRADGETGQVTWVADCHGDTYSVWPMGEALYNVGHAHYCGNFGGFPQTSPWTFHRGLAVTKAATGTVGKDPYGYKNFQGQPGPSPLHWYPEIEAGSFTGKNQGAWSLAGNSQYLVAGGEFPTVNGVAQQGLVRFAVKEVAPNKQGPWLRWAKFVPAMSELPSGGIRGTFTANWDTDNEVITYKVIRNGNQANPIREVTVRSNFWKAPTIGFLDPNVQAGQTYNYRLHAIDPYGNVTQGDQVSVTATKDAQIGGYPKAVLESGASLYWRLGEATGNAIDWAGNANGVRGSGVTGEQPGAVNGDSDPASTTNGTATGLVSTPTAVTGPQQFSVEAWIKTTTTQGGKIIGFGNQQTATSSSYDRHLYLRNDGRLVFGVYNGATTIATSPNAYNDGQWHHVVGTMNSTDGMKLYVDGLSVAQNAAGKSAQSYNGFWRIGGDNLNSWPNKPTSNNFAGTIDEAAVYGHALASADVVSHYVASGRTDPTPNTAPTADFGVTTDSLQATFDSGASADPDGSIASYAWDFGDGESGTGKDATHTYAAEGTYDVTLTVTDNRGATATATKQVIVSLPPNVPPTADFTVTTKHLKATVDASGSADPDGTITGYAWDFGDGTTATGATPPAHTYAAAGTYDVTLTVTDNRSGTATKTTAVTVAENAPPTAQFTVTKDEANWKATVDASAATDSDGTIASYAWDFGDGSTDTGKTPPAHTYAAAGEYDVTLTVTDNDGGVGTLVKQVTFAPNVKPVSDFTVAKADLTVTVNGSAATDSDGTITSYAWDFGDGATATGKTPAAHTYAAAGTFPVTLTVTDNHGDTDSKTVDVAVTAPVNWAVDDFARTLSNTLGWAQVGGAWSISGGTANFSVANGAGRMRMANAGSTVAAWLGSISTTGTDSQVDVSLDKAATGGGAYVRLNGRRVSANTVYQGRLRFFNNGQVVVGIVRNVSGTETVLNALTLPGVTYQPGDVVHVRFAASGTAPTDLRVKAWVGNAAEPGWQLSTTDNTAALQANGSVGIEGYLSGSSTNAPVVLSIDNWLTRKL